MIGYGLPIALLCLAIVFLYAWSSWVISRGWTRCCSPASRLYRLCSGTAFGSAAEASSPD
jgi:hypothetical protein